MEVLTIFYALLAALTGISVGDSAPQRAAEMGCTAAALVSDVVAAEAQQREQAARPALPLATALVRSVQPLLPALAAPSPRVAIAWIDLARRHL